MGRRYEVGLPSVPGDEFIKWNTIGKMSQSMCLFIDQASENLRIQQNNPDMMYEISLETSRDN